MSNYDDDQIEFDFFDEPETVEATQRRRLPRLDRGDRGGDDGGRPPRTARGMGSGGGGGAPTGLVPLARLVGLIAIAIAVIVGLVFWVGSCQGKSKHDAYASYADKVRAIQRADKALGTKFAGTLNSSLKQSELETSLAGYAQQEQQEYTQAQEILPPGPLRRTHQQLLDAIELRYKALAGLSDTLASAGSSSKSSTSDTADALAAKAGLLTASDIVWEQLYRQPATDILKQESVTGVVIPSSTFVSNPELVSSRAFDVVLSRLSGASTGGTPSGKHGSALIGVHVSPQGADLSTGSAATIQVSADLTFRVTFENSGDFPEINVPVTLKIDSGSVHIKKSDHVTSIQPTEQASVDFKDFQLPPDAFANKATVTVTIGKVPGETKLDNNTASYPVFFTLSS
jgi:hypothetical protein